MRCQSQKTVKSACLTETVEKGDVIVEGPLAAVDVLELRGLEPLTDYIVSEVQEVYRLQGVKINDKHIEVIIRQMLRRVRIVEPGDTRYFEADQVERSALLEENDALEAEARLQQPSLRAARNYQGIIEY